MPEAALVLSPAQPYPLRELAHTLVHELGHQGVPSRVHTDGFPEPRPDRVYVWLDPRGYLEAEGGAATPDETILRRTVFLYDEHRAPVDDAEHLELAGRGGAVFTLDAHSGRALHRRGVPARVMRPGYSPALDHFDPQASRPIDIAFLGSHTLRRTRHLAAAADVLSRYRTWLQIADRSGPGGSSSFLAEDRWSLLTSAKVLINLHCGEANDIEWRRVLDAIHAGAVVVTEHSMSISPLIPGEHLLVASAEALPFVAETLLRDPQRLARMRSAAYERLSAWMPFSLPVSVLRAALVELVGEPVSPQAPLGSIAPRVAALNGDSPPRVARAPGPAVPGPPPAGEIVAESPAWAQARPNVGIVATMGAADAVAMLATLESSAASAGGAGGQLELLVVDDGGSADTVTAAADWLKHRPGLPSRLLCLRNAGVVSPGLARNAGLSSVRAPATLIIDGGQQLYRRCIPALVEALDEGGERTAVAYPIQKVIGDPEAFVHAGGDYLLSFTGWDPARLREGNPVHAPVLLRTEVVRELGGFATEATLRGREDHDLWCRLAERGWEGRLVREVLARRPESAASASLVSSGARA